MSRPALGNLVVSLLTMGFCRLTIIYKFLRVANLVWLIFSALMVEFTLNFNHVTGVLGGKHEGGLQLPSQLLPFLVGLFSFIRISYQLFKAKLEKADAAPSDRGPADVAADVGFDDLQTFGGDAEPRPPNRSDSHQARGPMLVRYVFAWLPWLGLVLRPGRKSRISTLVSKGTGLSQYSRHNEEMSSQPKRAA